MTISSAGELMTENIQIINTISSAQEASKKMRDKNVSSLLVMDGDKPTGIVTERDLVRKVCVSSIDSGKILIKDIMSTSPFITIDSRLPVETVADIMIQNNVRHLLVTSNNDLGKIVGIITPTDFIGYLKENSNLNNEVNSKILEILRKPRGENILQELEQEGRLQRDSQTGGQKYEDEKPRQG
ncbi:MAG: CBS domain-containing protein [Thermoproteota archaeon]|jgi:CBS domain-containing protein|nr:CBS domain-containing protein [Thermoproteota archaeon]